MKKITKSLLISLALMLLVCGLTACGSKDSGGNATATEGKLIIGTSAEYPPFEYVDANGILTDADKTNRYDGIDMAIAQEIGKDNGWDVEIANMEFDSLLISLQDGKIDAVISGMTVTDERKKSVDFSDTYFTSMQTLLVPADSDIKKAADMKDKRIVCVQGYTGQICLDNMREAAGGGFNYQTFKKGTDCVMEVANGKADVFIIDWVTSSRYAKSHGLKVVEDPDAFVGEEFGIAIKKGNTKLTDACNKTIKRLKDEGKIDEWLEKYNVERE